MLLTLLSFVVVIGVIILVHEWGHFIAARLVGIRVEVFSVGFGPAMWTHERGGTEYRIAWFPLGGYVRMAGMIDESLSDGSHITGAADEFMSKRSWQKALVISAGVLMNGVLAFVLYTLIAGFWGVGRSSDEPVLSGLMPDMPGAAAGLKAGDRVLEVEGQAVTSWKEIADAVHIRPDLPTQLKVLRAGAEALPETLSFSVTPKPVVMPELGRVGLIGIDPGIEFERVGPLEALSHGLARTAQECRMAYSTIASLVSGQAGMKDLGGPILIAQLSGDSARGGALSFLAFIAFISVNIGFLNILPFPVLDGGHLVYIFIEALIRRPIPNKVKLWVQQAGMVILLLLMVLVMKNDVMRLVQRNAKADKSVEQVQ